MTSDQGQLVLRPAETERSSTAGTEASACGASSERAREVVMSLHISKLRGIDVDSRMRLKQQGISYTDQLLEAARDAGARARLVERTRIDEARLLYLLRRADLARIKGIGAIFADMLGWVGVHDTAGLAGCEPAELHRRLATLNAVERLARRAPTPGEVADWVAQARALPWRLGEAG